MTPLNHPVRSDSPSAADLVHDLRKRWKPHKLRLQATQPDHPTAVRFHRACSWLQSAQTIQATGDLDLALLNLWIALNALYGQWDVGQGQPVAERESWRNFLARILRLDGDRQMEAVLREHKRLVMAILDDAYLSSFFWQEPGPHRANKSRKAKYDAQTWYVQGNLTLVLERVVERIYLLRCQLVHGAATHGGKLNRTALYRCHTMLGHLLPVVLRIIADHGADEDWGPMCYPPLQAVRPEAMPFTKPRGPR